MWDYLVKDVFIQNQWCDEQIQKGVALCYAKVGYEATVFEDFALTSPNSSYIG